MPNEDGSPTTFASWIAFANECDICGQFWAGVAPVGAVEAQCPGCGHFCGIPGGWTAAGEAEANALKGSDDE